jgi:hypothetical protein
MPKMPVAIAEMKNVTMTVIMMFVPLFVPH